MTEDLSICVRFSECPITPTSYHMMLDNGLESGIRFLMSPALSI